MKTKLIVSGILVLGSGLGISSVSPQASAAQICRDIDSVRASADLSSNTGAGGHVTQHVLGLTPPPGTSQVGKTLFADSEKFGRAWGTYQQITNPRFCSGGNNVQQVFELGYYIDAFSCRAADGAGRCTEWDSFAADRVAVAFIRLPNGRWILNTAYPIPVSP